MKYTLAIFDLDGTILYTLQDLANSLNYGLRQNGFPERTLEEVRRFVGNGIRKLIERGVPDDAAPADVENVYAAFTAHYREHNQDTTCPYDGITELLNKLRGAGMRLAVVSNKADYAVQTLCARFSPGQFAVAVGEKPGVRRKPAPDPVNAVLERLGISRENAVYIGDSEVDIQTAQNAGMDAVIVSWGFRDADYLREQGAQCIVAAPDELYAALAGSQE